MNDTHFLLRLTAGAVAAFLGLFGPGPVAAAGNDPFATQELAASSQAGSVRHSLIDAPCEERFPALLALADVVERALCNNPQTREAWANARVQAAQVGIARSAYLPSLSVTAAE